MPVRASRSGRQFEPDDLLVRARVDTPVPRQAVEDMKPATSDFRRVLLDQENVGRIVDDFDSHRVRMTLDAYREIRIGMPDGVRRELAGQHGGIFVIDLAVREYR